MIAGVYQGFLLLLEGLDEAPYLTVATMYDKPVVPFSSNANNVFVERPYA